MILATVIILLPVASIFFYSQILACMSQLMEYCLVVACTPLGHGGLHDTKDAILTHMQ